VRVIGERAFSDYYIVNRISRTYPYYITPNGKH